MRKSLKVLTILIAAVALVVAVSFSFSRATTTRAASCTPTGFIRDSIDLTAAMINPPTVNGKVDATGCNIGVYYAPGFTGKVKKAEIFGANYFGVVNNGGHVTITSSYIHNIGEVPFNGTQHGVGIYFADMSMATGSITNNLVSNYQKGGIVVNGVGSQATISNNSVNGLGPVNFIAQNGIEVGDGAKATVQSNLVTGNSYTGSGGASSGGILVFGGTCYQSAETIGTNVNQNILLGNDVGIFLVNADTSNCVATLIPTRDIANNNYIRNDAINNTSGFGPGDGYQAGVSDYGNYDKITNNTICGKGYTPVPTPPPHLYRIDVTGSNNPIVKGNKSCDKQSAGVSTSSQPVTMPHVARNVIASLLR